MMSFSALYRSPEVAAFLKEGFRLKALDKKTDTRLAVIRLASIGFLTALGFIALHLMGAIAFFLIAFLSSFAFSFSMKKKLLLTYLSYYRNGVFKLFASAVGKESALLTELPETLPLMRRIVGEGAVSFRMAHKVDDAIYGYIKTDGRSGLILTLPSDGNEGSVRKNFGQPPIVEGLSDCAGQWIEKLNEEAYEMLFDKEGIVLFIPDADYLPGRVECADDLSPHALQKQWRYFLLGQMSDSQPDTSDLDELNSYYEGLKKEIH